MRIKKLIEEAERFIEVMQTIKDTIGPTTFKMTQAQMCEEYTKRLMQKYTNDEMFTLLFIIDAYQDN